MVDRSKLAAFNDRREPFVSASARRRGGDETLIVKRLLDELEERIVICAHVLDK